MVLHQSLPSSSSTTASHDAASVNNHNNNNNNNKRRVRFQALVDCLEFDGTLTDDERELVWYNPDELKARSKRELTLARQLWKNTTNHHHHHRAGVSYGTARNNNHRDYCWRGLEKRLRSPDAQRKKWYTFLHSFLALQEDVRHMDRMNYYTASHRDSLSPLTASSSSSNNSGNHACCHYYTRDNTHLLMVFASTNSKADRAKAHQVGLQDEAEAYKVYSSCSNSSNSCTLTLLRPRRSSLTANTSQLLQDQEEKDREAAELRRAFSLKLHLGNGEQPQQQQPGTSSSAANGNVGGAGVPNNSNNVKACARARSA